MGGGDKGLLTLGGQTLLARVIDRLEPQVAGLALNANGDPARFDGFGLPVVGDSVTGFAGPLAGVLAGLEVSGALRPLIPAFPNARPLEWELKDSRFELMMSMSAWVISSSTAR